MQRFRRAGKAELASYFHEDTQLAESYIFNSVFP